MYCGSRTVYIVYADINTCAERPRERVPYFSLSITELAIKTDGNGAAGRNESETYGRIIAVIISALV